ncbi:MAG TPA: hypothetical protein PK867_21550, partial [Pirellulales bacterium]|nr:hypothetical protein [Pirellulales bacterium]
MPRRQATSALTYVNDDDELTAVHAVVASSRLITDENIEAVLAGIDDDQRRSAGIVRAVLRSSCNPIAAAVNLLRTSTGSRRSWLLYLLASEGRARCAEYLRQSAPELLSQLEFFWTHQRELDQSPRRRRPDRFSRPAEYSMMSVEHWTFCGGPANPWSACRGCPRLRCFVKIWR